MINGWRDLGPEHRIARICCTSGCRLCGQRFYSADNNFGHTGNCCQGETCGGYKSKEATRLFIEKWLSAEKRFIQDWLNAETNFMQEFERGLLIRRPRRVNPPRVERTPQTSAIKQQQMAFKH